MMGLELRFAKIRWPSRRDARERGHQPPLNLPLSKGGDKEGGLDSGSRYPGL
jgi:hypothetical protein